jgi:hypothetical protein
VPIKQATLTIKLPQSVDSSEFRASCYVGTEGSNESCGETVFSEERAEVLFRSRNLSSGAGLTGALGFPKGVVPEIERELAGTSKILIGFLATLLFVLFVFTLLHVLRSKKKHTEPKGRGMIMREYDVPPTLRFVLVWV